MAEKAGGFSLSLGGAARRPAPRRPAVGEGEGRGARDGPVREEVLGFGADGGLQTAAPAPAARGPLVIPNQEKSDRCGVGHGREVGGGAAGVLPSSTGVGHCPALGAAERYLRLPSVLHMLSLLLLWPQRRHQVQALVHPGGSR